MSAAEADTVLDLIPVLCSPVTGEVPQPPFLEARELQDTSPEGIPAVRDFPVPVAGPGMAPLLDAADRAPRGIWRAADNPQFPRKAARGAHARETAKRPAAPRRLAGARPGDSRPGLPRQLAAPRRPDARLRLAGSPALRRPAASSCVTAVVIAAVIPLCLLRLPYAAALQLANPAGAQSAAAGMLRAASLALPCGVAVMPLAALAVWRMRAWPVLAIGMFVILSGDGLNGLAGAGPATGGPLAAFGGALTGVGAGLAVPATVALVTEHAGSPRRLLAFWWAAVAVAALAVLPRLSLEQQAGSGWLALLGPAPWLTVVALIAVALHPMLTGPQAERVRAGVPQPGLPQPEGVRLALLALAAAALTVLAVAATYRPADTIGVAAACAALGLLVMAAIAVRGTVGDLPLACAAAGFVLAPASAGFAGAHSLASAFAAVTGALAGAGTEFLRGRVVARAARDAQTRHAGAPPAWTGLAGLGPLAGLLLATAALVAASLAGPSAPAAVLGALIAAVAGGFAAALARPAGEATPAGTLVGVVLLAAASLTGYLASGAISVHLAAGPAAAKHAPPSATRWWELAAAAVTVTVAIVTHARRTNPVAIGSPADPRPQPRRDPGPQPRRDPGPQPRRDPGSQPYPGPIPQPRRDPGQQPRPAPSPQPRRGAVPQPRRHAVPQPGRDRTARPETQFPAIVRPFVTMPTAPSHTAPSHPATPAPPTPATPRRPTTIPATTRPATTRPAATSPANPDPAAIRTPACTSPLCDDPACGGPATGAPPARTAPSAGARRPRRGRGGRGGARVRPAHG